MAKHLYLPPVTSDANLNEPAHIGQWEQNEPRILNALSQGLSVDEKAKSRGVSSVPDVWARPLTFQSAIRPASHHPLKKQLLNEWRGLMSLLALREVYGYHVEIVPVSLAQAREAAERQAIELALLRHRGRLGDAAQELGISRVTLYRLLCSHGMRHMEGEPLATPHGELPASVPHL